MIYESCRMNDFYKENGYCVIRKFAKVEKIADQIYDLFSDYTGETSANRDEILMNLFSKDLDSFVGCAHACQSLLSVGNIATDDKMIATLIYHLGLKNPVVNTRPCISFSSKNTAKKEYYWKTPPHQDWPSTQGSLNGLTCWIPLVDVTTELGPLEVAPKTHLLGPLPWDEVGVPSLLNGDNFNFIPVPMEAGDAIFFSNFLVHRSGNNTTSDKIRMSMHFRYDDAQEKFFMQRKYPKHKKEVRADGNIVKEFPLEYLTEIFS